MATIASLFIYPVKSCAGINLQEAVLGKAGLEYAGVGDREWMIVDEAGRFLTQREAPSLACVRPQLAGGKCVLRAPGAEPLALEAAPPSPAAPKQQVTLWEARLPAVDCGNAAAGWFTKVLGRAARLVRFDPRWRRESNRAYTGDVTALNRFSDGYPLLLLGQASLEDLNERLRASGRNGLPMNRFRPNIVVAELGAYDEDHVARWSSRALVMRSVKPCPRCAIPSVDQATGEPGPDPRDILATYRLNARHGIVLGQNVVVERGVGARLRVGQTLQKEWNF